MAFHSRRKMSKALTSKTTTEAGGESWGYGSVALLLSVKIGVMCFSDSGFRE